jgi:flagellar motor component MotA
MRNTTLRLFFFFLPMQTNLASVTTDEQKMRQAITEYMLGA